MSLPVFTAPEAEEQIRTIHGWWTADRPAAPDLFADELAYRFELLGEAPRLGKVYRSHARGLRRVLLRATRYHVYYYTVRAGDVLVVWHSMRGQHPPL